MIALVAGIVALMAAPQDTHAQRGKGGGGGASARPSAHAGGGGARPTINGGSQKSPARATAPQPNRNTGGDRGGNNGVGDRKPGGDRDGSGSVGDRKPGGGGNNSNNRGDVNIGSGNTNVNVNIDNSRNTTVRRNTNVHYNRPPYRYGGRSYYCYHPYHYHPYRPFYWGPVWHPWGFFVATMATTAIIVSVNNQQYHYDQGVYYAPGNGGYTVVAAPVGATITTLPANSQTVVVNETTNNYYYGGTYYEQSSGGYTVVPPTAGCVVENLPEGGEEVKIGDVTYVKVGETYYQPFDKNGKDMYEVVDVVEGEG